VEQLVRQMDEVGVEKAVMLNWAFTRELERAIKDIEIKQKIQTFRSIYLGPSSARMFLYSVGENIRHP
jgi:hypothetical protein